jgi:hypothetical protein
VERCNWEEYLAKGLFFEDKIAHGHAEFYVIEKFNSIEGLFQLFFRVLIKDVSVRWVMDQVELMLSLSFYWL